MHGLPAGGHAVPASPAGNLALAHAQVRAGLVQRAVGMPTAAASPSQGASVAVATSGFHWGDAVIGAGSTLMLALIGGTALVARGRRRGPISA